MTGIIVFFSAVVAGVIQAVTGFGSGIFMMLFFPAFFPVLNASALSASITLIATATMSWRYRKNASVRLTLIPSIFYITASTLALSLVPYVSADLLLRIFGAFLLVLSIYFLMTSGKIQVKGNILTAVICSFLSGAASGLFGIGGPPMVLYFLAVQPEKESYLGTIQLFFFITGIYTFGLRAVKGIYTVELIPYTLLGMIAVMIGKYIGERIIDRINADTMRTVIYLFLGITGAMNLLG